MPTAEIITIGTEILLGEIVDTNTRYLARALRGLGVDLYRTITIGDNAERISEALRASLDHADIIITTGGLGPTVDDPTREAVARAFGTRVEFREELWAQIVEIISRYGRQPGENQKRQAYVPEGALAISNPVGTAPAFIMESGHRCVISLPGVPKEMEHLWQEAVVPYLQARYNLNQIIRVRLVHTSGASEAVIDERIDDLERLDNPTVGLAAHSGIVDVRIAAKADSVAQADEMIAGVEAQIRERLGDSVFGVDDDTLEGAALQAAFVQGWNLAAVESGLDGALLRRLTNAGAGNLVSVEEVALDEGQLPEFLGDFRARHGTRAALGIAAFPEKKMVELALITPESTSSHTRTFGGPSGLLPRWAVNIALNWLWRTAKGDQGT